MAQVNEKYTKPESGIPKSDLAEDVKTSLGKADTAVQSDALSVYAKKAELATVATSGSYSDLKNIPTDIAKIGNLSNPNLLINPNFAINQRGKTSYTGDLEYTVDRWKKSYGILELLTNGEIKHTSSNSWQGVAQYIENPSRLAGKTVTISAMGRGDGATAFRIYLYYQIGTNSRVTVCTAQTTATTNTIISTSGTIPEDITDNDKIYFMLYNSTANTSFYCKWAKLEIGSVATEFSPPSIAEELPKCQRYFLIRRGYSRALTQYSLYQAYIGFGTRMRIAPTSKIYAVDGSGKRVGAEKTVFNITTSEIVDIARNPQYVTSYGCLINSSGALIKDNEYMFDIECDAEL